MTADTKKYSFHEVFKSPFEKETEGEALDVLQKIRDEYPASKGWVELNAYAEKLPNGKWRAVRDHAKV